MKYNLKEKVNIDNIQNGGIAMNKHTKLKGHTKIKHSKKYAKSIKKKIQISMFSIATVLLLIAGSKLAGLSVPINKQKENIETNLSAEESKIIEKTEKEKQSKITIAEDGAIECDSIVQGVRDSELENGTYTFRITGNINGTNETKDYKVELINYYDDVIYELDEGQTSKTISLGDSSTEHKMLVVKYHKNLTINSGVTVTATNVSNLTYKKGMYLCVIGELKNKGTISMTARGTYNCAGENVYLWKNLDDSYEYIPSEGAAGLAAKQPYLSGSTNKKGNSGINRATGGGGQGASIINGNNGSEGSYIGASTGGNSYSGGNGAGGLVRCNTGPIGASATQASSNAGGNGYAYDSNSNSSYYAGGGAGIIGGTSSYNRVSTSLGQNKAQDGTGGLLIIYTSKLNNSGKILSEGSNGAGGHFNLSYRYNGVVGGGGSGGGSINIFAKEIYKKATISSTGGQGGVVTGSGNSMGQQSGGPGGSGSTTLTKTMPDLNYPTKEIKLNISETYNIDKSKIVYMNISKEHTDFKSMGKIEYEILDKDIASINDQGKITGKKEGKTKVKITDITNNISTYIYLEIINNVKIDVQEGKNFTIALKQNGTVWSYGLNNNGQLGIVNNEDKAEATQIEELKDITEISTGYSHSLALTKQGEVYAWGENTNGQLGNGDIGENSVRPQKVDAISNIIKIDAYKNKSIALSSDGKVYVWGEGYSSLPMRLVFSEKVVDISGNLILTEKGKVYNISNTETEIVGLTKIAKISCGEAHNLALDVEGIVYTWGTNTNGECGTTVTGEIGITKAVSEIYEISAGNGTSILQGEDGNIYVLGNNANGQIGLGTTAKVTEVTKIDLAENVQIENISAGEGTHSGIVDKNGFVWHTGINTKGELGIGNIESKSVFTKTGDTILAPNCKDTIVLDIEEEQIIEGKLENSFNLKIDLIDDNPENFKIEPASDIVSLNGKTIKAKEYGNTNMTVTHLPTGKTRQIEIIIMPKMESIIQGFRDADLENGEYTVCIKDEIYKVEFINYYGDVRYSLEEGQTSRTVSLGDESTEHKTLVVKYHGNLTIDKGVTITATTVNNLTYKKGMYICVLGDIYNEGKISMTARGTYNAEGEDVYLWKNINDTYEYVPAEGAKGLPAIKPGRSYIGTNGNNGTERQTGGGGQGSAIINRLEGSADSYIGSSTGGNSYAGGNGSGALVRCNIGAIGASATQATNTSGGNAHAYDKNSNSSYFAGGGAGTIGGNSAYNRVSTSMGQSKAENGVGGLLMIYSENFTNEGSILSEGSEGAGGTFNLIKRFNGVAGGAGSGGGSINIFTKFMNNLGVISSTGGNGGKVSTTRCNMGALQGGSGGSGTVTINELGSILNYAKKTIGLKVEEEYQIEREKLWYVKLNEIQTEDLIIGNLRYETENANIAIVDEQGKIVATGTGETKIKITDIDNGYSTYITIKVTKEGQREAQVKAGKDFVVALKENGTVWTWGTNEEGQLGQGGNVRANSNEPIQIKTSENTNLENIKQIEAGESKAIALDEEGNVYTWGAKTNSQLGTGDAGEPCGRPQKIETISNIEKINSYKENFYAIDKEGKGYIWGESNEPIKIETEKGIEDIKGEIFLGEDGKIYYIEKPETAVEYLNGIRKIEEGEDHYEFLTVEGKVYSIGKGDLGQLGKENYIEGKTPNLVKTKEGYLENVKEIGAGNKTGMAITEDGKIYVWGDNTNGKLGIEETKINYAKEITKVQDKEGRELIVKEMEIVEGGNNNTYIGDKEGNVYSVGINDKGQLGIGDNIARKTFTQIGQIEIKSNPEDIKVVKGETKEIGIIASNSFNLKKDLIEGQEIRITNTNEKEIGIEKIEGIDNSQETNIKASKANYKITGRKIGRVNIVATNGKYTGNIWINVVNEEQAKAAAKIENGKEFTIALKADGTVWSWGTNENGELGIGNTENKNEPTQNSLFNAQNSPEIIDISVGESHVIALNKQGEVYTWGKNNKGQLGTGNTTTNNKATKLNLKNIKKVKAKGNTTYAITKEGKVYAWGENYGKTPSLINIEENVIDIGNKYYLTAEGKVKKVKDNSEIKIETVTTNPSTDDVGEPFEGIPTINLAEPNLTGLEENSDTTVPVNTEKIVQITEGEDHVLLLGETGKIYSYGQNTNGQLGIGTNENPDDVGAPFGRLVVKTENGEILENIVEISAGNQYSIAVDKQGKIYTWGKNGNKQLGHNNEEENGGIRQIEYAKEKEDIENIERIEAGYTHTSVYTKEGNVYTWGEGEKGQLGTGEKEEKWEAQKIGKGIIETNTNEILIEEGENYKIESKIDNFNVYKEKSGEIEYETLDEGTCQVDRQTGKVTGKKEGRTEIIAKEKGTENKGIIKIRILEKGTKPETMGILIEPQVKTAGSRTTMLKVDGTVWSYGIGKNGELGTGKEETTDKPVQAILPEGTKITKIAIGENHNLALDSQGNVWSWGRNNYKQLGIETTEENILTPTKIENLKNIKDIECGSNTSYAIGKEGQIYSWGQNENGEGGIGNTASKIGINEAKGITNAIDIKAGKNHVIALKSTGEIYATGTNLNGELGIGNNTNNNPDDVGAISNRPTEKDSPRKVSKFTKIETLQDIVAIGTGDNHSMSITENGTLWGWGSNINGELGLGTSIKIGQPTQIPNLENIKYIDGGRRYSIAINNQGEMYTTGTNENGEQGNGSKTSTSTYQKLETIENVMQASAGKRHTAIVKKDGTVWACGNYTQGNEEIESKTKSETPIQMGENETGIEETEITIGKGKTKKLTAKSAYRLNLIKLEENYTDNLTYESVDQNIATVDEKGIVKGIEKGQTTIKATTEKEGKEYNVQVEVIEAEEGKTSNANLLKIEIDGDQNVEKREDGTYHYELKKETSKIEIKATTEDEKAQIKIETGEYETHETTKQETIIGNQTEIKIRIKAEDGTTEEYTLIIEKAGNNTRLEKVEINGQQAKYIESKNRYEIKLDDEMLNITATAEDKLATVQYINIDKWLENEANVGASTARPGANTIEITKEGKEAQIQVKVTSQNGKDTETYTIAILEKSNNTKLENLKINGQEIEAKGDGSYYVGIKHNETEIQIEATAEDENAKTAINEETQNSYIVSKTETIEEGKTIYTYTIKIQAENGEIKEYNLTVEQLEGNTNIIKILVGEEELNLNEATLKEDGTYYYKINRVTEGHIKVELESEKSTASINGTEGSLQKLNLPEETNEIKIKAKAEDGTEKEYKLIIEKKSTNVEIEEIAGEGITKTEIGETEGQITINEELQTIEITITLKNDKAKLKLEGEENYEEKQITRAINIIENEETGIEPINLEIQAEDGTEKTYRIYIIKDVNVELETVKVNNETLEYNKEQERYETKVENGNKPQIEIKAQEAKQTIQLLSEERTILATGIGTLTTTQTLGTGEQTTKYIIKVISDQGEENGTSEKELWITQKSTETGIIYVKVDGLGTSLSTDKTTYTTTVSGKQKYPIEIKLKDIKAEVEIEDTEGNTIIEKQTGTLKGELEIGNGKTKQYKIKVTAENGNQKEYTLEITRISNESEIEEITITDYNENETETITKEVTEYNEETKTYKIQVSPNLKQTEIKIKTNASNIEIEGIQTTSTSKTLSGQGTKKVKIKLTAGDGTEETRYLEIIQLSNNANIEYVKINGKDQKANETEKETYNVLIPKQAETIEIEAKAENEKAKIVIGDKEEETQITNQTIDLRNETKEEIEIRIKITAEDGKTIKTYTLKIKRTGTIIEGKIKTENIEEIHKAKIIVYKIEEITEQEEITEPIEKQTEAEQNETKEQIESQTEEETKEQIENKTEIEQPIKQKATKQTKTKEKIEEIETEEDGTYELIVEIGKSYDIEISKKGYLTHTITNIETKEEAINLGEKGLIAGDVAENGEIEIDDLVDINDNYGIVITEKNKETKGKYDLNEDGKIDIKDRDILKKNYGKLAETIRWKKYANNIEYSW